MKHQTIFHDTGKNHPPPARPAGTARRDKLLPGVVLLALALVGAVWGYSRFNAEARLRRATIRVVRLAEKSGEESPVALGLAANRLGALLAANVVLDLEGHGPMSTGRQETVQLFAQIRSSMERIVFQTSQVTAMTVRRGEVRVLVSARTRFDFDPGGFWEGDGNAVLVWIKGDEGWRISRATLRPQDPASVPGGWL